MRKLLIILLGLLGSLGAARGQLGGLADSLPTTAPGADFATYAQLFGTNAGFTAHSEVRSVDKNEKETMAASMELTMLDNKLRLDMDATKARNRSQASATAAQFKQLGMDQVVVIMRADKARVQFLFPKAQFGIFLPMEKADLEKAQKATVQNEKLGEETLDGHPCVKSTVTITNPDGEKQEITVWRATDLKGFPIQTIQKQEADTVTTKYSKVQFGRPDATRFETPAGVEEYEGMAGFIQGMMKKALNAALPGGE